MLTCSLVKTLDEFNFEQFLEGATIGEILSTRSFPPVRDKLLSHIEILRALPIHVATCVYSFSWPFLSQANWFCWRCLFAVIRHGSAMGPPTFIWTTVA